MKPSSLWLALAFGATALTGALAAGSSPAPGALVLSGTLKEQSDDTDTGLFTVPWRGGGGQVEARIASVAGVSPVIASAPLQSGGRFALTLPATLDRSLLPPVPQDPLPATLPPPVPGAACTGSVKLGDPTIRVVQLSLSVKATKSGVVVPVVVSTPNEAQPTAPARTQQGLLYYAERPTAMNGTQTCQWTDHGVRTRMTTRMEGPLKQGWNKLTLDMTSLSSGAELDVTFHLTSGALPTDDWTLMPEADPGPAPSGG
ncbi:hypothetical protein [Deinococcus multiflagellatus]|uniref:hypothetical protein n=1 Tax=Deinococcus multiflagellatus TaxID=1656887 RepID=UPI001CCC01B1|nr:hypothetical protein [Deinococcus multiflagellatus]MBZ9714663.1 hypothetical protein [Deinococcus multiflagellatus]